jgi:hypothetical protein
MGHPAFEKIDKLVSAFNKASTTEQKMKVLKTIIATIEQARNEQNKKPVKQ